MKLSATIFLSLDGVYQVPAPPTRSSGNIEAAVLVESRSTPSGVTILTYRPAGRATFGTVEAFAPVGMHGGLG